MKNHQIIKILVLISLVAGLFLQPQSAQAATYTVTNTLDSGTNSLRWAINQANANPGSTINFAIPVLSDTGCSVVTGICEIRPVTAYYLYANGTTINAYSQTGAAPATATTPADIRIRLNGSDMPDTCTYCNGFNILSSNNVIKGFDIISFRHNGIAIAALVEGVPADNNVISGNYIGLDVDGLTDHGNTGSGVYIGYGATHNTVGGDEPAERNVLSGNEWEGVGIHFEDTSDNIISGNYIGTDESGTLARPNTLEGIRIYGTALDNTIGGDTAGERNIISGNNRNGITLVTTTGNTILGNYIGTAVDGQTKIGNVGAGINISTDTLNNFIGGDTAAEGNVISGNSGPGIKITGTTATWTTVTGNIIGMDKTGLIQTFNNGEGIRIENAVYNFIGGDDAGEKNIIAGNFQENVTITGSSATNNVIAGNWVGLKADGSAGPTTGRAGILINGGAHENTVGGNIPSMPAVISGNRDGIQITGEGTDGNIVHACYIGTNTSGTAAIPNTQNGIKISGGAENNDIHSNVISGNALEGVSIEGTGTSGNLIYANLIGLNAAGDGDLGNTNSGVTLQTGCSTNRIGGTSLISFNIISGNGRDGVSIYDSDSNTIAGNRIGTDSIGEEAIPNDNQGIDIAYGSQNNTIGAILETGNQIAGNHIYGIQVRGTGTNGTIITGNTIGLDADNLSPLPNEIGIQVWDGASGTIIGGEDPGEGNLISGNTFEGIYISGSTTAGTEILRNNIGTGTAGNEELGNGRSGIMLYNSVGSAAIGPGNKIAFNGVAGVKLDDSVSGVLITQNSIYQNTGMGIILGTASNGGITNPVILSAPVGAGSVTGTACGSCRVEIFTSPTDDGEGKTYLGYATANAGGSFTYAIGASPHPYLTATATDADQETSEFSGVYSTVFPDLSTSTLEVDAEIGWPEQNITYTFTLINTGSANSYTAYFDDYLPDGVDWIDSYTATDGGIDYQADGHRVQWNGDVLLGTPTIITLTVRVNRVVPGGELIANDALITWENGGWISLGPVEVMQAYSTCLPLVIR